MRFNHKFLAHALIAALFLSLIYTKTEARDNEFGALVKHIESHYRAKRTRLPFLGLAGLIVKVVHPAGVKGFKLAVFEDQDFSRGVEDSTFESVMSRALGNRWQPLVRVYSRKTGERTYIYAKESGKDLELMVATLEAREAVVMQVKLNPETLAKWLEKPDQMGGLLNVRRNRTRGSEVAVSDKSSVATAPDDDRAAAAPPLAGAAAGKADEPSSAVSARPQLKDEQQTGEQQAVALQATEAPTPVSARATADRTEAADVRINTRLINLNTKVTDAAGRTVLDLKRDDFEVYEDGVRQEVSHFVPVTAPVSLVLLLDLSGSTKHKQKMMKQAAKKFVASLGAQDHVADFTTDRKRLNEHIWKLKSHGSGTAYYDAMWAALDLLKNAPNARKDIVVLTDGVDNSLSRPDFLRTKHDFGEVLERAEEENVTVYPLYLDTEYEMVVKERREKASSYEVACKQLATIAEQTGGLLFHVDRIEDLEGIYERVAAELRTLYSLAYAASNEGARGQWRSVKVKVSRKGLIARTKRGYYTK